MNHWLKIALLSSLPVLAQAHTASPYVLPEVFDTKSNNVSFQSGVTVEKFFVKKANISVNPDEVVAMGAAIEGGVLQGDEQPLTSKTLEKIFIKTKMRNSIL